MVSVCVCVCADVISLQFKRSLLQRYPFRLKIEEEFNRDARADDHSPAAAPEPVVLAVPVPVVLAPAPGPGSAD